MKVRPFSEFKEGVWPFKYMIVRWWGSNPEALFYTADKDSADEAFNDIKKTFPGDNLFLIELSHVKL